MSHDHDHDHDHHVLAVAVMLLCATAWCSSEDEGGSEVDAPPAVCSAVDALQTSVASVTEVDLDRSALSGLRDDLTDVRSDLGAVRDAAEEEYVAEIYAVELSAGAVGSILAEAVATPTPAAIEEIGIGVQQLGETLASLQEAVVSTC